VIDVEQTYGRQPAIGSPAVSSYAAKRIAGCFIAAAALIAAVTGAAPAQQMSLPGNFSVSAGGAATYDIAIAVPPGTAGMVPSLKFSYSSQGVGNGLLGVGWSLSGLASIGRCAQTMDQDSVRGAITYTTNDRFCLDGQRLVAISGSYGADGTEYRTEIDSFSRIISHGTAGTGPAWFEVHTKAGQIMQFGNTTESQVLALGTTTARNWALNQVSDTKGNYFTVSYFNDDSLTINPSATGQAYPIEIDYTGNTAAGLAPYNKVTFTYGPRNDTSTLYQAGSLIGNTVLLTDVITQAGGSTVAHYHLTYQQSTATQASEITSIGLCTTAGTCPATPVLPSTTASWLSGFDGTFTKSNPSLGGPNFGTPPGAGFLTITGDFNGDGKTDFAMAGPESQYVYLSNGDGTFALNGPQSFGGANFGTPPQHNAFPFIGDFNGDGKTDWMMVENSNTWVFMSNGNGTFNTIMTANALGGANFGSPSGNLYLPISGDFDGDGRTDWAILSTAYIYVYLSKGDGTFTKVGPNTFGGPNWGTPPQSLRQPIVGDFNGDGKTDWMMVSGTTQWVYLSNGDGTFTEHELSPAFGTQNFQSPPQSDFLAVTGDFNGDGKTDWAMMSGTSMSVFISKGDGTFVGTFNSNAYGGASFQIPPSQDWQMISGDFNADGKTDFTMIGNESQVVFLGNGNGTFTRQGTQSFGGTSFGTPPQQNYQIISGDFNGDGKTDFSVIAAESQYVFLADGPAADFVQTITTGLGATTTITHQPITQSSVYTKDATAVYPVQDLQGAMYVVSRVDTANGVGGNYSATYSYVGAKSDLNGRGFLGFRQMAVKDLQTNIVHTTTYNQLFPYLGLTASETKALGSLNLNQSTNTYQLTNASGGSTVTTPSSITTGGAPYQVSLSQSVASSSDLDGSAIPTATTTYVYDPYGNPTQVVTSTPDGFSKTTTNTYTNNTTSPNWFLGLLTNATVTSTTP
jgi:hypothetical protein